MNNINSILIEGNLTNEPKLKSNSCFFKIGSFRRTQTSKETISIEIKADNALAKRCYEYLKKDRGVRVVGRLSQKKDGSIYITAEHVEFKPPHT